jgi:hypothetical protein
MLSCLLTRSPSKVKGSLTVLNPTPAQQQTYTHQVSTAYLPAGCGHLLIDARIMQLKSTAAAYLACLQLAGTNHAAPPRQVQLYCAQLTQQLQLVSNSSKVRCRLTAACPKPIWPTLCIVEAKPAHAA